MKSAAAVVQAAEMAAAAAAAVATVATVALRLGDAIVGWWVVGRRLVGRGS